MNVLFQVYNNNKYETWDMSHGSLYYFRYEYNTDKTLRQLKITRASDDQTIGAINWYAVHPVSMNNTNCLVTSDNVGYASILLEAAYNIGSLPGKVRRTKNNTQIIISFFNFDSRVFFLFRMLT